MTSTFDGLVATCLKGGVDQCRQARSGSAERYVKEKVSVRASYVASLAVINRFHMAVALGDRETPGGPTAGLD